MVNSSDKTVPEQMEDEYDAAVAADAYTDYVESGCKSRPIADLWGELNL